MRVKLTALVFSGILLVVLLVVSVRVAFGRGDRSQPPVDSVEPGRSSAAFPQVQEKVPVVTIEPKKRLPKRREAPRIPAPESFVVLDLETTGLSPFEDEIIEFGAIRLTRETKEAVGFRSLVKPERRIPPLIAEITGITQQLVDREGSPLAEALPEFLEFLGDLPLVAYNAKFDVAFLCEAASKHGLTIKNTYTCALEAARCAWPRLSSYKLDEVYRSTHREGENVSSPELDVHRALGDCKRTVEVFVNAANDLEWQIPWNSVNADHLLEDRRTLDPGGKRRGSTPMYEHSVSLHGAPGSSLSGEVVVFTGSLSIPRGQASSLAAAAGCEVRVGVTHRTTMVVVGVQDLSLLAGKKKSCKHLAAEELIREGQLIRILSETDFMRLMADAKVGVTH